MSDAPRRKLRPLAGMRCYEPKTIEQTCEMRVSGSRCPNPSTHFVCFDTDEVFGVSFVCQCCAVLLERLRSKQAAVQA